MKQAHFNYIWGNVVQVMIVRDQRISLVNPYNLLKVRLHPYEHRVMTFS